ncbi:WD40 repeat-containing protein MSI4-like protein [Tanacetum coccineum]
MKLLPESEVTDGSVPNTLVIANYEIVKPRVAAAEHISQFSEEARSPYVKKFKTIIHPGEVNRIRELPQNNNINVGSDDKAAESPVIQARGVFHGHEDTVEDMQFCPSSGQEFCSVGDDSCLILWDARTGSSPVVKVEKAHDADLHCVDWNPIDQNLILTGSADNTIRLFDRRNLTTNGIGSPIHIFENHTAAVLCVQWSPDKSSVFGSSAEDGILNVWDHNKQIGESSGPASKTAQGLLFRPLYCFCLVLKAHIHEYIHGQLLAFLMMMKVPVVVEPCSLSAVCILETKSNPNLRRYGG